MIYGDTVNKPNGSDFDDVATRVPEVTEEDNKESKE